MGWGRRNLVFGTSLIALSDNFVTGVSREIGLWQFHLLRSALAIWTGTRARPRR